jgi:hypothetical protein
MLKDIDTFKIEKEVDNYKNEFMKTFIEFKAKAKEWVDKNNYSSYILSPTLTWSKEKPFILKYVLEVKQFIEEE